MNHRNTSLLNSYQVSPVRQSMLSMPDIAVMPQSTKSVVNQLQSAYSKPEPKRKQFKGSVRDIEPLLL
jgi:hypothetical protein